jgi:hypothetical protein
LSPSRRRREREIFDSERLAVRCIHAECLAKVAERRPHKTHTAKHGETIAIGKSKLTRGLNLNASSNHRTAQRRRKGSFQHSRPIAAKVPLNLLSQDWRTLFCQYAFPIFAAGDKHDWQCT